MKCAEVKKYLSDYIDNSLNTDMKKRIEEHLRTCAVCSEALASLKSCLKRVSHLKEVDVPEDFLKKVHERIEQGSRSKKILRALFVPPRVKVPLELAVVLTAVVIVIFLFNLMSPSRAVQPKAVKQIAYEKPITEAVEMEESVEKDTGAEAARAEAETYEDESAYLEKPSQLLKAEEESPVKMPSEIASKEDFLERVTGIEEPAFPAVTEKKAVELVLVITPVPSEIIETRDKALEEPPKIMMKAKKAEEEKPAARPSIAAKPMTEEKAPGQAPDLPALIEVYSHVQELVEQSEGKVISSEEEEETGKPVSITAEIPIINYSSFLEELSMIGELSELFPFEPVQDTELVQLRIKFVFSD